MDVTTVLREQQAGIRRALVRAALPGPGRAREFRWQVVRRAAREEREEFPVLDGLGPARRRVLAVEISLARELAPTRPHPRVNGELGNKLTMPVPGPADRIRDFSARLRDTRRP